jgi:hypothetical protein
LRELEILSQDKQFNKIKQRYFALPVKADGVKVEQGDSVEDLASLILLDEELEQSDRFMAAGEVNGRVVDRDTLEDKPQMNWTVKGI